MKSIGTTYLTASTLKAILCYIDATKTPKIAYDKDEYAIPLIDKIKSSLGESDGSQRTSITFNEGEQELARQFNGVVDQIAGIFKVLNEATKNYGIN